MATAVQFGAHFTVKGLTTRIEIGPRRTQERRRKFWGVSGESDIHGGYGGRPINVTVLIYDSANVDFDTARKLADYLDVTLNTTHKGKNGTLTITSESNHAPYSDCKFQGVELFEGPKKDHVGSLGGGYFAECVLLFEQLG